MKLTTKARNALPASKFALPGGRYPIEDRNHAINAKARAAQQLKAGNLSRAEFNTVNAKADRLLHGRSS